MNISADAAAGGLYSFKSWYASRLAPVRRVLVAAEVPPGAITMAGIFLGGGAGAVLPLGGGFGVLGCTGSTAKPISATIFPGVAPRGALAHHDAHWYQHMPSSGLPLRSTAYPGGRFRRI